ncbi:outer membrane protein assembly factor BamB family protein [Rhizomonospora bruguierae]|uniref:outer membrane protein assembly factor BamB family protein n=1 Tax=Rhizomonospora bruguierae TaxID=1581705 RepID=UPI001BD1343C|nr:PQQ-binding-like beta-propeller repeat protein [Micromonospora sp. NBRC 107566]
MLNRIRNHPGWVRALVLPCALVLAAALSAEAPASATSSSSWPSHGHDIANTRSNPAESKINTSTAGRLKVKWTYRTHGDVSATPAVVNGAVYFPDWGGYLNKVNAQSGVGIWSRPISDYTGRSDSVSRSSPAVVGNTVYIADYAGATLIAVNAANGSLLWKTVLDTHPFAVLTQSPQVYDGVVYQGVSSRESELAAADPTYPCCSFRGSANAVDAHTGRVLWKTYTVPDNGGQAGGYSGAAVWGAPAIDPSGGIVYVTTGNNYHVPASVSDCQTAGGTPAQCMSPDNHVDSVLALNMRTGRVIWASGARLFDAWNLSCFPGFPPNNCPVHVGPDYDFGDGAHLLTIRDSSGRSRKVVGGGQKSGQYWLLDAATGAVLWSAATGPGGKVGGILWGTATDGHRIYLAQANFDKLPYQLPDGTITTGSSFAALDAQTGAVVWQVADVADGYAWAPVSVANGVVFASSTNGHMYAINAATGRYLWDFKAPYSSNAGAAVVDGIVYWGNGYVKFESAGTTGSTTTGTFYAFSVDGR